MNAATPAPQQALPRIRFVGDMETGLLHRCASDCEISVGQVFLDARAALVRGYNLCGCCWERSGAAQPVPMLGDIPLGPALLST